VVCSKGVADLTYDAENRLARVSGGASASFVYDGDGQRVAQTINDVTTYFIGNYYEVTNGVVTKYYYAGGQRIALRQNGTLYYLLSDHLGSTTLVTDASGNIVSELRYKPWGETRYNSGSTPTRYQYTGQGCVPKSSENLSGQADFLPGPVPFCFSSHSGAPEG
jgi:YD repeat-containing protein